MKSKKSKTTPLGFGMELVRSGVEVKGGDISPPGCGCYPSNAVLFGFSSDTECGCACDGINGGNVGEMEKALERRLPITGYIECP